MADIKQYTDQIAKAVYGEEVRGSIIGALNKVNDDNNSYQELKDDVLDARDDVEASATEVSQKASYIVGEYDRIKTISDSAEIKIAIATEQADKAERYAVGDNDSAKYYYEQVKGLSASISSGGIIPCGTVDFASLPSLDDAQVGWMYNLSDDFTTTVDFEEGAGEKFPSGTNVYKTVSDKWDVLAGGTNDFTDIYDAITSGDSLVKTELSAKITQVENTIPENLSDLTNDSNYMTLADVTTLLSALTSSIKNAMYPVGAIYMSTESTNPESLFGGTWVAWGSGRVPVGINSSDSNFNTVEKTGGASSVNLSHSHTVNNHTHSVPAHAHASGNLTAQIQAKSENSNHTFAIDMVSRSSSYTATYRGYANYSALGTGVGDQNQTNARGAAVSGYTSNSSALTSGGSTPSTNSQLSTTSVLQPYITCYMWKRTA